MSMLGISTSFSPDVLYVGNARMYSILAHTENLLDNTQLPHNAVCEM